MADFYGVIATYTATNRLTANVPGPANWQTAGYIDGREKTNMDFYIGLGTEVAGSRLIMGAPVPLGAKVMSVSVRMSANTSSLTMSIGDLHLATRYGTALTGVATAGITSANGFISATTGPYVIGTNPTTPTTTSNDQQIILTTGGATLGVGLIVGTSVVYVTD